MHFTATISVCCTGHRCNSDSQFRVCVLWRTRPLWSSKASPSETLLTSSAVVKCAFGAFPGCVTRCFNLTSRFLPPRPTKVTIYATRCRHFLFFFLLFLSSFAGAQRIVGYVRQQRMVVVRPPKTRSIWRSHSHIAETQQLCTDPFQTIKQVCVQPTYVLFT